MRILVAFVTLSLVLVFATAFSKYIFAKDYFFLIETPCDSLSEWCYIRSCVDYCPPNELEVYQVYQLHASHFSDCTDNTCQNICHPDSEPTICTTIPCAATDEQMCDGLPR